ncbi:tetratricopeptide repeat protein [Micromonospora sp. NPDC050397]|uniref:tetratricopeptide repeat protein n=1 Tax=Micromonospora sp. NPDC050397 TaxID=3364279 RepID=UPI0038501C1A
MTRRVFGRRRSRRLRRAGIVLAVVAVLLAGVAVTAWWSPSWWAVPQFGWKGTEQAGWITGIVSGVLSLISTIAAVAALRSRVEPKRGPGPTGDLVQVGRIPSPAAWLQDRSSRIDLARAARSGRTAVLTQVLSGMGGVGKTQLAAQFARDLASSGELDVLVWVTAAGQDAIVAAYAETARALGLASLDTDSQAAAQRLTGWLERTDRRWLIVLDNLDTPADATGWWPPANHNGRTVVTTRRRDAVLRTDSRIMITVDLFTPGEAIAYLSHAVGAPTEGDELARLAADLGRLPIAVAQAAAFIRDRGIDCVTYRRRLADRRERLADLAPSDDALPDEHRTTFAATWALSIDAADASPPRGLSRPLLDVAALLDPNGIPVALFTTADVRDYLSCTIADAGARTAATSEPSVDVQAVNDALHNLHRLNLITHDQTTASVRVHALIQRAARSQLEPDQLAAIGRTTADALITIWPEVERAQEYVQTLRANSSALHDNIGERLLTPDPHKLLFTAANSLGNAGLVQPAAVAFQRMLGDCLRVLGADHPETLASRRNLAHWQGEAGNPAGAVATLEQLLDDCLRVLDPDHPDILVTRTNLARWHRVAGDRAGAVPVLEQLLADHVRVLGPDHPDTLATRTNLAHWRGLAGDRAGAVAVLEQLLADHVRVLGPDHPDTLATRTNLVYWQRLAGDSAGVGAALEQLLADHVRVFGADHPNTLATRTNLTHWRGHAGGRAGAVSALEQLLADELRVLGSDHLHTLATRLNLAEWRGLVGDRAGAVSALEQLLADELRVLGPDHPFIRTTDANLAHWRGEAERYSS